MSITPLGDRLNILITCDFSLHDDWMAFASWYSIYKNLPDANVTIFCARGLKDHFHSFQWPYRLLADFYQHENVGTKFGNLLLNKFYGLACGLGDIAQPLFVIDQDVMCMRSLTAAALLCLNSPTLRYAKGDGFLFFNEQPREKFIRVINTLANGADEKVLDEVFGEPEDIEVSSIFAHYRESCGQFVKEDWIREQRMSPFSFTDMFRTPVLSHNEKRILDLWKKMDVIYQTVR